MKQYEVEMRSVPGMYEQYNPTLTVKAVNDSDAEEAAYAKLKRSFPDRNRGMWKVLSVKRSG